MNELRSGQLKSKAVPAPAPAARVLAIAWFALSAIGVAACSSSDKSLAATTKLAAQDFKSPTAAAGSVGGSSPQSATDAKPDSKPESNAGEKPPVRTVAADAIKPIRSGPVAASDNIFDATADVGQPVLSDERPKEVGEPVFVDAKIGDVNNRAIYASAFVNELGDRLTRSYIELTKADARRGRVAWRRQAVQQIQFKLNGIIEDEVLRAEALNALKPEQKAGFFNWLNNVRSEVVAESRGIEAAANEQLSASNGTTLDQFMKNKEQQELINFILQTRIKARVNTSWRDIQLAYERQYKEYNPTPLVVFRTIQISARNPDEAKRVAAEFEKGRSFDEIETEQYKARRKPTDEDEDADAPPNLLDTNRFTVFELETEYAESTFFNDPQLNDAARKLSEGQHAGPFVISGNTFWIKLEKIIRLSMDLYNAQIGLEYGLTKGRTDYEQRRFVEKLKRRASFTDFDTMTRRLLEILEEHVTSNIAKGHIPAELPKAAATPAGDKP